MEVHLDVADESIEGVMLPKSFYREIYSEATSSYSYFLTKEEQNIISPNEYGEIVLGYKRKPNAWDRFQSVRMLHKALKGKITIKEINKHRDKLVIRSEKVKDRERDPLAYKMVWEKIIRRMQEYKDEFHLVHNVYKDEACKEEVYSVLINGLKVNLEGDLYYYDKYEEVRNKLHLRCYHDDYGKYDEYVEVKPQIEIDGKTYYTRTIGKEEQHEHRFTQIFTFLDKAIQQNKRILCEY